MSPPILFLFLSNLGLGTTITFASSHWLLAWMGLELNTLAIIPLMIQQHHPRATEASTKYFLVQAVATATLLFSTTSNAWLTGQWNIHEMTNPLLNATLILALSLKMGLAPLHIWLPEVLQGLNLIVGLILTTWQKLAPMILLVQIPQTNNSLLLTMGILSMLVGGWGGLNQTQLRKILAYSSIAHLGWMIIIIKTSPALTLMTLVLYITMTYSLFLLFFTNKALTINSLALSWAKTPITMISAATVLLAMGGLPPLTGFMPKWLILQELTNQDWVLLASVAALSSLLSLFFYLRLSYYSMLTTPPSNSLYTIPWRLHQTKYHTPLSSTVIMSTIALPLMPLLTALFQLSSLG